MPEPSVSIAHAVEGELSDPRAAIRWVGSLTTPPQAEGPIRRWVQLDAARRGIRPRDLGVSGRRDLAAFLRRQELLCSGVDLWIPAPHFVRNETVDRAVAAVGDACKLVADIDAVNRTLSVHLPDDVQADVIVQLEATADRFGVRVADHGPTGGEPAMGIDPAACFIADVDPAERAALAGGSLASARLSDLSSAGRCLPGADGGRLDLLAYAVALATAEYAWPIVIDLRGLPDVLMNTPRILERYREATALPAF